MPITIRGTMTRIDGVPLDEGKTGISVTINTKELPQKLIMELSDLYGQEMFVTFASPTEPQTDLFTGEENDDQPLPFPQR